MNWFSFVFFTLFLSSSAFSLNSNFLPSGVRAFNYRYITGDSSGQFNSDGQIEEYGLTKQIDVKDVTGAFVGIQELIKEINEIDPKVIANLDLGEINFNASSSFNAHVYSGAYGVNSNWLLGFTVPYITAETRLSGGFNSSNGLRQASNTLRTYSQENPNNANAQDAAALAVLLDNIPQLQAENVHSYLVNELNYKPIGNWQGSDLGDVNLFSRHRLSNSRKYVNAFEVGLTLNTGRKDDPDNLVDFAFGNEAHGLYLANLMDFDHHSNFIYGYKLKVTAFLEDKKDLRANEFEQSLISDSTQTFGFQKSINAELRVNSEYKLNEKFSLEAEHETLVTGKDKYLLDGRTIDYLSEGTNTLVNSLRVGFNFTTTESYKKTKTGVPYFLSLFHKIGYSGENTPSISRTYLDFILLF